MYFYIDQNIKDMFQLPPLFQKTISDFSMIFTSKNIYKRVSLLIIGAVLTQKKRTICSVLRTLNLHNNRRWDLYHRILSRVKWSALAGSKILLGQLISNFIQGEKIVIGIDETLERRWGKKIKARGIYRDAVRSSKSHFVKGSGLRWIGVMLLTRIRWANRVWALPFLTVLAASEGYYIKQGKRHKKVSDWARQISFLLKRWLPTKKIVIVGDGGYAVMETLATTRAYVTWICRFRFDAALYDFAPTYKDGEKKPLGRRRIKGERQASLGSVLNDAKTKWQSVKFSNWYNEKDKLMEITSGTALWYRGGKTPVPIKWVIIKDPKGKLEPAAILCTDLEMSPIEIIKDYLKRWSVEVTFEEVRAHLGVETQRQWSDLSILRTTPCLMALFSIVTIWADELYQIGKLEVFSTAWYKKIYPTFSDALTSVRYYIWEHQVFSHSIQNTDSKETKHKIFKHLAFMAARAT